MAVGFLNFNKEHANIVLKEFARQVKYAECKFVWLLRTEKINDKSTGFISYLNIIGMDTKTKIPIPSKFPIHFALDSIPKTVISVRKMMDQVRGFPSDPEEHCWIRPGGRNSVIENKKRRVTFALDPDLAAAVEKKRIIDGVEANTIERDADIAADFEKFRLG
jgi:hypothetical protein